MRARFFEQGSPPLMERVFRTVPQNGKSVFAQMLEQLFDPPIACLVSLARMLARVPGPLPRGDLQKDRFFIFTVQY